MTCRRAKRNNTVPAMVRIATDKQTQHTLNELPELKGFSTVLLKAVLSVWLYILWSLTQSQIYSVFRTQTAHIHTRRLDTISARRHPFSSIIRRGNIIRPSAKTQIQNVTGHTRTGAHGAKTALCAIVMGHRSAD